MNTDIIIETVCALTRKFKSRDPFDICERLGITVNLFSMGKQKSSGKGFLVKQDGITIITINSDLDELFQRFICSHELGHAILHTDDRSVCFSDNTFFDYTNEIEKEANFFAAELLLSDNDILDSFNDEQLTYATAAAILRVPVDFLDYKLRIMKYKGYKLIPPMIALGNCFIDMEVKFNDEYV